MQSPDPASAAEHPSPVDEDRTAGGGDEGATAGVATVAPSRKLEVLCAAVAVAASGALVLLARAIEVRRETGGIDPRWWPELLGIGGLALSALLLIVTITRPPFARDDLEAATGQGWVRAVTAIALTAAFVAAWPVVGFLVATPVFLAVTTYLFGGRGWKPVLLYPAVLTMAIYLLFHTLLKVPL